MATMEQINFQMDGDSARPVLDQHVINHGLSLSKLTDTTPMGRHGVPGLTRTHYLDS